MRFYVIDNRGDVHGDTDTFEKANAMLGDIITEHPEYRHLDLDIAFSDGYKVNIYNGRSGWGEEVYFEHLKDAEVYIESVWRHLTKREKQDYRDNGWFYIEDENEDVLKDMFDSKEE